MKMMYQIKHINKKSSWFDNKFFRTFSILSLILIAIFIFGFSNFSNIFVFNIFSPFFKIGDHLYETVFKTPNFFSDKNKIIEENIKLSYEIENMRINLVDYESVKFENERLYKELGLKPAGNLLGAKIIAKPPQIPLDTLFIDQGVKDGVSEGSAVLVGEHTLIGKIVKTSQNRAVVALNSFPEIVSYGYIERTNEPLEIKGIGGGILQAKVPIDFDIMLNDKILVEGSRTYVIATVGVVEADEASGFKNILMSLPVNISKTHLVFLEPFIKE